MMKGEGVKVEEISSIEMEDLMSRIKNYQKKYGAIYDEFMKSFKDEEASFEELIDQFEWQTYWLELRRRLQQTGMLKVKASRLEEYAPIFTPLKMKILSYLLVKKGATVSEIAKEIGKPVGSVSKGLEVLRRHNLVAVEPKNGRKVYRPLVKEITITV